MSLTDEETVELHDLLDGLVENNLSPSKKAKLEKWIEELQKTLGFMDLNYVLMREGIDTLFRMFSYCFYRFRSCLKSFNFLLCVD